MTRVKNHQGWALVTLLLALALVWPSAPASGANAQAMTMTNGDEARAPCCLRCDDGGMPEAPCAGSAAGCLGGAAITVSTAAPINAAASPCPDGTLAPFRSWLPDAEPPPPKIPFRV